MLLTLVLHAETHAWGHHPLQILTCFMTAVAIDFRWEELFLMKNEHGASFLHQNFRQEEEECDIGGGVERWWCHGKGSKAPNVVAGSCVINHKPHKLCTPNFYDCLLMCMGFNFSCGFWKKRERKMGKKWVREQWRLCGPLFNWYCID